MSDFLVSPCSCQPNLPRYHSFGFLVHQLYMQEEAPYEIPSQKLPPSWPAEGRLEFKDISLSYRPSLHSVLNGVSMSVSAGEKIGIAGRTGAGKSSTMIGSPLPWFKTVFLILLPALLNSTRAQSPSMALAYRRSDWLTFASHCHTPRPCRCTNRSPSSRMSLTCKSLLVFI